MQLNHPLLTAFLHPILSSQSRFSSKLHSSEQTLLHIFIHCHVQALKESLEEGRAYPIKSFCVQHEKKIHKVLGLKVCKVCE